MNSQLSYAFTAEHARSAEEQAALLGGKGAGLAAMTAAGLPVPPGFTITTEACRNYLSTGWTPELEAAVDAGLAELERQSAKRLGSTEAPLLVSVRSGAQVSMPGMMDTVLNVGMNAEVEASIGRLTGQAAFAEDTHRRALLSLAEIVLGAQPDVLQRCASRPPAEIVSVLSEAGVVVPSEPVQQVKQAIRAVFDSWKAPRAVRYREIEGIDADIGTAATVQAMVFGNMGDSSGTGVAFSRNPTTGEPGLMGDFLADAQGEDVVAGGHVTLPLGELGQRWPEIGHELQRMADILEHDYRDMVDIEFTVEQGRLWLLQSRKGKRSPVAAFRMAVDMAEEASFPLDRAGAVARCQRYFDAPPTTVAEGHEDDLPVIAEGLGASPGRGTGVLCLDPDRAVELQAQGVRLILARRETSPSDVHGMAASSGLFTTLGGQVSHAALVAREWGLPAVVGASEAQIVEGAVIGPGGRVEEGTVVTVDGDGGRLLLGQSTVGALTPPVVQTVLGWAAELGIERPPADDHSPVGDTAAAEPGDSESGADPELTGVDLSFHAFHALRIKGMVTATVVAAMCAAPEQAVTDRLNELVAEGNATFMEARQMWIISPDGRTAHQPVLAAAAQTVNLAAIPYEPFLALNDEFKQLCTDWQLRDGEPNDHTDADYDAGVRERLASFDDRAQPILTGIGDAVPWMAPYGPRLVEARARLLSGDEKALTGVMCDSYHDIWMELHEDLILTQGIDRAAEGST